MKILYLHQYFTTPPMAGGTRSYEMARRLVQFGHEVHMITSDRQAEGHDWVVTQEDGIHVHWLPVPYSNHMGFRHRVGAFFRFAWSAGFRAAGLDGDIIFATSTPLTIALPAAYAARRKRIPMVFEVRDLWPEIPIAVGALKNRFGILAARWLEKFAYRRSSRIVALSPGMKQGIVATGYPEERVAVIPNSCDFDLFDVGPEPGQAFRSRNHWLGQRPLVVYAGTLGQVNGVGYLARLAAAVSARDPEVRFLVVGTGREEEEVRRLAGELGVLGSSFFMMPGLPKADMPALLSAATLAVSLFIDMPELRWNSANKFFDALAAGKPVAVNHEGWISDLLRETGSGLVLDARDVNAAADQLVAVLRDRDWLVRAGAAASRLGRERFDRDQLAGQLNRVLHEALACPAC